MRNPAKPTGRPPRRLMFLSWRGLKKVCGFTAFSILSATMRHNFYKGGAKRRNLIPPTPFSEKGVAPLRPGYSSLRPSSPVLAFPALRGRWHPQAPDEVGAFIGAAQSPSAPTSPLPLPAPRGGLWDRAGAVYRNRVKASTRYPLRRERAGLEPAPTLPIRGTNHITTPALRATLP